MDERAFIALLVPAFCLDLILGDPACIPHPVRWIGRAASGLEPPLRRAVASPSPAELRFLGALFCLTITLGTYLGARLSLALARGLGTPLHYLIGLYLVWTSLALRSLRDEAASVIRALEGGRIEEARALLSRIVGRETAGLGPAEICRAVEETVAENTSDGVTAPLFYLAIGGPALMLAYKAVNTLDSMVGYRNERYRYFGWFPARLDDWANYVPARLTAAVMVLGALVLGLDWQGAAHTLERDGRRHPSPNAGLPEAALAGALGLRFGGTQSYDGVEEKRPFIGEPRREHSALTAREALRMLLTSALLLVPATLLLHFFVVRLL